MDIKNLYTNSQIRRKIRRIAKLINNDLSTDDVIFVCVLKGGMYFFCELTQNIEKEVLIDFVKVKSYEGTKRSDEIDFQLKPSLDFKNKNVILVDDVLDTGHTLDYLKKYYLAGGAKTVKICVLLDKKEKREKEIEADYKCFIADDYFAVGYGLDYNEKYINVPFVGYIPDENDDEKSLKLSIRCK